MLKVRRAPQSDTCVPRGAKANYDPRKPLEFQILHWNALDEGNIPSPEVDEDGKETLWFDEERQYTIYITGSTKLGNSVTLRTTFNPFFLLKLERIGSNQRKWANNEIQWFMDNMVVTQCKYGTKYTNRYYQVISDPDNPDEEDREDSKVYLNYASTFCGWEELQLKDLGAGFTGIEPKKFQYIKLSFTTRTAMKRCASRMTSPWLIAEMRKKQLAVKVYEANIEPHIRFMHLTKVEAAGWCRVPGGKYTIAGAGNDGGEFTKVDINLREWSNLRPLERTEIARFRQVSFDLETYSPEDDKFSTATKRDNYIIQIASYVTDFGVEEGKGWRYLYTLKDCPPINEPRTRVVCFEHESQMLMAWARFIQQTNPDIVHAYNGWNFDYGYLAERAILTGCWEDFRRLLGRFPDQPSQLVEKEMKSNAYGDNHWKLLTMSGRLVIDPMVYIQREFRLNAFNLKYVSEYFLAQKLKANPLRTTQHSRTVTVTHAKHGLTKGKVVHFSGIDTPDMVETEEQSWYVFCGWTYEDLHGDGDGGEKPGLHTITRVLDENTYEIEMPTPATKTCQGGGGKSIKVFETKHDISFPEMFRAWREQDMDVIHKVGRYCLAEDSQILTNKGFLFLDELLQQDQNDLLICGYDPKNKQYVYEPASDVIVNGSRQQDMIEFTNHNESLRWGESSDPYGRYIESERNGYSNNVSLIVTPEHDMYARLGRYRRSNPGKADCFQKSGSKGFAKWKAGGLLTDDKNDGVQFLAFAENGVANTNIVLPFIDILELHSEEQINAFLSMYGYWLGDGCLQFGNTSWRGSRDSILFSPVKEQDVDYLMKLFDIIGLVKDVDFLHDLPTKKKGQHRINVVAERYTTYFRSQYQENYKSHRSARTYVEPEKNRQIPEEGSKTAKWLWEWCWDLSQEQSKHLIDGLRFADGSETAKRNIIYMSSVRFRDEVLRLCLHAGYSVRFKSMYLKGESRGIDKKSGKEFVATKDAWAVDYAVKNVIRPALKSQRDIKKVTYTGRTWCVTVPHGFIVTRRAHEVNGVITKASRPTIQGNCIQDTLLPQKILDKLCVLPNLIEMAKVTWVPVEDLLTRGQQIKVFSQILKIALEQGWAVPMVKKKSIDDEDDDDADLKGGYIGGAVLEPYVGFHDDSNPVGVPDFMSLYPTTMIDGNFCYTTLVKDPQYLGLPGVMYNEVVVDEHTTHTFAMNYDGLVPQILIYLLRTRSKRKKDMRDAPTEFMKMIHNGAQLALKVSANSIYGFTGVSPDKAMLQCMPIAESTTKRGRDGTFISRDLANDESYYRDVIACTTHFPLYYVYLMKNRENGACFHLTAQDLLGMFKFWNRDEKCVDDAALPVQTPVDDDTPVITVDGTNAPLMWTSAEWTTITGFSRVRQPHFDGDLIRVHSDAGTTLSMHHYDEPDQQKLCEVVYGDSVTGDTPVYVKSPDGQEMIVAIDALESLMCGGSEQTRCWQPYAGFKVAPGGIPDESRREKQQLQSVGGEWSVWSAEGDFKGGGGCEPNAKGIWTPIRRVIRHKTCKEIFRVLTHTGCVDVTEDHSLLSDEGKELKPEECVVGQRLLHASPDLFGAKDNNSVSASASDNTTYVIEGKTAAAILFRSLTLSGLQCTIEKETANNVYNIVAAASAVSDITDDITAIKKVYSLGVLPTHEFVYDIETDSGAFQAGIGNLIIRNTDSIFCKIGCAHLANTSQAMRVAYVGIVCAVMGHKITQHLKSLYPTLKHPDDLWMLLEYEKTYRFWIIFSKKRYVGEMTEFDPYSFGEDEKGVAKKRRDFCSFVKEVYSKILKALFDDDEALTRDQRIANALAVVRRAVEDLLNNRVPFEKLIISKLLKDAYRAREKKQTKDSGKKTSKSVFGPHNIYVGDEVIWKCRGYKCIGVVEAKDAVNISAFLNRGGSGTGKQATAAAGGGGKPLSVVLKEVEDWEDDQQAPNELRVGHKVKLRYNDIYTKCAGIIKLDKILDPATTDDELVAITNAHVRLARRMYLRDPATAPPSGSRVPYVFCEPKSLNVLQYLRAENPAYAKAHKMKIDPVYYLEKQCAKAWGQILNTIQPGLVDQIFNEAYALYEKQRVGQPELFAFLDGSHIDARKRIKLSHNIGATGTSIANRAAAKKKSSATPPPQQQTLSNFFRRPAPPPAPPQTTKKPVAVKKKKRSSPPTATKKVVATKKKIKK